MPRFISTQLLASGLLLLLCGLAKVGGADESEANAAIAKLLQVGWSGSFQSRAAADLQYQELQILAPGDPRALTASWLVLMQQRRYDEALKRIDECLAKQPGDLEALRARAWTQAILKNYSATLLTAEKISAQMAEEPPISKADAGQHAALIEFLGRLCGYLGGPVADQANQDQRKAAESQFLSRLSESHKPQFEKARDGVLAKFIELSDTKADERDKAIETAQSDKEKTLQEVAAEREQIIARTEELDSRREKLQSELKDELSELGKQDAPLVQELARLDARAAVIRRDLFAYQADIDRLERLAAGEKDPVRRQQLLFEADRLSVVAARIEADLVGVNRLASGVQAQRAALAARAQQAQANTAGQVQRIDRELQDLAKRDKRADGIEKRAGRPATGTTSKVRSLSAQATALTTYDQFPLEAAREKLLESLR
ncbi:MAG TPA: hypothetical protein VFV87_22045 [Pirellulaceae bacterium]|nr:hypothetical protein [Pirellulaceae bacterium]